MKIENTKKILIEIRKGIILGLLLTSLYGIGAYVYKNQNKNKSEAKTEIKNNLEDNEKKIEKDANMQNPKNKIYEKINGYEYKRSENENPTFVRRNLGYEKRFSKTSKLEELENGLKEEYCNAVREIEKVDQKIVPGTNIPFKEATYMQVHDAYKEYLQKIAQIRDIFIYRTLYDVELVDRAPEEADQIFENNIKCKYNDTKWNIENSNYMVSDFYNSEIGNYYSE